MDEYICDDRRNTEEYVRTIQNMTDEEFEAHVRELREKERKNTINK